MTIADKIVIKLHTLTNHAVTQTLDDTLDNMKTFTTFTKYMCTSNIHICCQATASREHVLVKNTAVATFI